jgi:hypothetical protein
MKMSDPENLIIPGLNYEETLKKAGSPSNPNRYEFNEQASDSD